MFLLGPRENTIIKYPVGLATPYVGYAKIIDGKIKVNKNNNLYDDGTSIDDMTKLVKEKAEKIK